MLRPESLTAHQRQTQKISVQRSDRQTRMTSACLLPPRLSATRDSQQREYRNYLCWKCRFNKYQQSVYCCTEKMYCHLAKIWERSACPHRKTAVPPQKWNCDSVWNKSGTAIVFRTRSVKHKRSLRATRSINSACTAAKENITPSR